MIILTSLSPKHSNGANQTAAISSWNKIAKCFSLNAPEEEKDVINSYPGISIITTDRTMQHLYNKPLVNINEFFHVASKLYDDLLITNSDIIIKDIPAFKQDGITVFSRYDYIEDIIKCKKFENGFDVFYIPKKYLGIFPPSIYALGACWHDYYTPLTAINKGIPVYTFNTPYSFHKIHSVHYPQQEYFDIGEIFRWEFKFNKKYLVPHVAQKALAIINSKLIRL